VIQGDRSGDTVGEAVISCLECGRPWTEPHERWRLYISAESDDPCPETGAYCPACAQREFGDPGTAGRRPPEGEQR
jgi:hypothetical protein